MKLFLAVLILFAGAMPAAAQWLDRPWPDIPRTADGAPDLGAPAPRGPDGHPDFNGVWRGSTPLVRLDTETLQPWVADLVRQRQLEYYRTRPFYRCLPSGPESQQFGGWKRIVQSPSTIAILNENLTHRVIHLDGRELEADPLTTWAGYSVGRWDGDTLVVDTIGFAAGVLSPPTRNSEQLHIVERFTLDPGTMALRRDYSVTDPVYLAEPYASYDVMYLSDVPFQRETCIDMTPEFQQD